MIIRSCNHKEQRGQVLQSHIFKKITAEQRGQVLQSYIFQVKKQKSLVGWATLFCPREQSSD